MADRTPQLLEQLARVEGWTTATELAERLGVTTRTVRSWVTAIKSAAGALEVIASSPNGYRLNREAYAAYRAAGGAASTSDGPGARSGYLVNRLVQAESGLDVHELAAALFISDSTLEHDLRRVRAAAVEAGATLRRDGSAVRLEGSEESMRRLIGGVFRRESEQGLFDLDRLQEAFGLGDLDGFRDDVVRLLEAREYAVNEFGLEGAVVHTAIAVARSRAGHARREQDAGAEAGDDLETDLGALVLRHFGAPLPRPELAALAVLLTTRVGTPIAGGAAGRDGPDPEALAAVRTVLARAEAEYLVDLSDETFVLRLAMHVSGLVHRTRAGTVTRNPLARSIKASYPLIYELAVFLSAELQRAFRVSIAEDEIGFIALHVGARLQQGAPRTDVIRIAVTGPDYHDLLELARTRLAHEFGDGAVVELRSDADLVVTSAPDAVARDAVVTVAPLLTERDVAAVRAGVERLRLARRRAAIREELARWFDEPLFVRDSGERTPEGLIRLLGARLETAGIVDDGFVPSVLERETLSSTAFTAHLAMPHAMTMGARRTAIAVAIESDAVEWGGSRIHVVALAAFSAADRAGFQTALERFAEVFANDVEVRRFLEGARDYRGFLDTLAGLVGR